MFLFLVLSPMYQDEGLGQLSVNLMALLKELMYKSDDDLLKSNLPNLALPWAVVE